MSQTRTAFTLIELLVVVSIIAILAAMLLPAIATVRISAQQAACLGNLRQVGMAYLAYAADSDDCLPNNSTGMNQLQVLPALLDDYLPTSDRVWSCTDRALSASQAGGWKYYMNWWIRHDNLRHIYGGTNPLSLNLRRPLRLSDTFLAADLNAGSRGGYHRNRTNAVFADGHAASRSELQSLPYATVTTWADPGQAFAAEFVAARSFVSGGPGTTVKGISY